MGKKMTKRHQPKGFTLVELSIVIVIIGLLIGGMLKGYRVMEQSRVTATITMVGSIDGAAKTFYDTYSSFPGDMLEAPAHLPDCDNCGISAATNFDPNVACIAGNDGGGNGVVGSCVWNMYLFQSASYLGSTTPSTDVMNETVLFWLELSRADLISGITDDGITNGPASFGGSLPKAPLGGGFTVGYASATGAGSTQWSVMAAGTVLLLSPTPALTANPYNQAMSPVTASQIDRKLDDGLSTSGFVMAYGSNALCQNMTVTPATYYPNSQKYCSLFLRILR
jgi:prepilin-type N-terminal cleavage/methylation domain-containing protein